MQNFDIVTLRVFLAAARAGSIGAAARSEHIAASAISRRISDLEHDLGITLIQRTPSGVTLTPAGRVFVRHCETILSQFTDVRADLKQFSDGMVGELRIAAVASAINERLPASIAAFRAANPAIDVSLCEVYSRDGPRFLREDLADLAIVSDTEDLKGFETRAYVRDPVWVVGSSDHPLFEGREPYAPIPFAEMVEYEHLSKYEGGVLDELVAEAMRAAGKTPARRIRITRFDALRSCAEAGLGLGFLRESSIRPFLAPGKLKGAPLADEWADRQLVCAYSGPQTTSPVVGRFLTFLEAY